MTTPAALFLYLEVVFEELLAEPSLASPQLLSCIVQTLKGRLRKGSSAYLVWLIGPQSAAEVCIAPGKGLVPRWWDQNLVLLHCKNPLVCADDLPHGLLEFCKEMIALRQMGTTDLKLTHQAALTRRWQKISTPEPGAPHLTFYRCQGRPQVV